MDSELDEMNAERTKNGESPPDLVSVERADAAKTSKVESSVEDGDTSITESFVNMTLDRSVEDGVDRGEEAGVKTQGNESKNDDGVEGVQGEEGEKEEDEEQEPVVFDMCHKVMQNSNLWRVIKSFLPETKVRGERNSYKGVSADATTCQVCTTNKDKAIFNFGLNLLTEDLYYCEEHNVLVCPSCVAKEHNVIVCPSYVAEEHEGHEGDSHMTALKCLSCDDCYPCHRCEFITCFGEKQHFVCQSDMAEIEQCDNCDLFVCDPENCCDGGIDDDMYQCEACDVLHCHNCNDCGVVCTSCDGYMCEGCADEEGGESCDNCGEYYCRDCADDVLAGRDDEEYEDEDLFCEECRNNMTDEDEDEDY